MALDCSLVLRRFRGCLEMSRDTKEWRQRAAKVSFVQAERVEVVRPDGSG